MPTILAALLSWTMPAPQGEGVDLETVSRRADALLGEARSLYEEARSKSSVPQFVEASFKLEEARIKFLVLQEVGTPELQTRASGGLRAIQQLHKLINDGRVALAGSGAPAGAPGAGSPPPAAPPPAPSAPPGPSGPAKPDKPAFVRYDLPDPAKQKEIERTLRDLFKEAYAKKAPEDRLILARTLLDQASRTTDDPAALWVLYREAQEAALQGGNLSLMLLAVEESGRYFDVDVLPLKAAALAAAAKAAKTSDECGQAAEYHLHLAEEWMAVDLFDHAEKAASTAQQLAKKAALAGLAQRAASRVKELSEAKALFQSLKKNLEILAKAPDHPGANLEMGQYLCFVKGSWEIGPRFLSKGSNAGLKTLAERELAVPLQAADRIALGDGWWDFAEKEKSTLRKSQILAHARSLYESALGEAGGLLRARVEKRLAEGARPTVPGTPVDLLPLIDVKQDTGGGDWACNGKALTCSTSLKWAHVRIPYAPPEEYDLTVVAERLEGEEALVIGLSRGGSQFYVALDGWGLSGGGLGHLDGKWPNENETFQRGALFRSRKASTILYSVRRDGVKVSFDGRKILDWKGDFSRLSNALEWRTPDPRMLFVGANSCRYTLTRILLTPVSGEGRRLR